MSRKTVGVVAIGLIAGAGSLALVRQSQATVFASSVAFYQPGDGVAGYTDPSAATGAPHALTGDSSGFPNVLSPFSPPFEGDELTGIGLNGILQLSFPVAVNDVPGPDFGVFTNIGLVDANYPSGANTNPAGTFNPLIRSAEVMVSGDGVIFETLGRVDFVNPSNYFADASNPYLTAPPAGGVPADFGKPFTGNVATFNGLDWPATLAALGGSAGGTWIDFSATSFDSIRAVRFSISNQAQAGTEGKLFVDALAANNSAVPEPTGLARLLAIAVLARRTRRAL